MEESINSFYGFKSANSYLEKFIDLNIKFPKRESESYRIVILEYVRKFGLRISNLDIVVLSTVFDLNSRDLNRILQKIALMNELRSVKSTTMAFIYLAMEQKSMSPSRMTEKQFLDNFMNLLVEYVKNLHSFQQENYDYNDLAKFANQFGSKQQNSVSGLSYLLKYYYLEYGNESIDERTEQLKEDLKKDLNASGNYGEKDLVKSWDNYINSGFIID